MGFMRCFYWKDTFKKLKSKLKYTEYLSLSEYLLSSSNHKLHHLPWKPPNQLNITCISRWYKWCDEHDVLMNYTHKRVVKWTILLLRVQIFHYHLVMMLSFTHLAVFCVPFQAQSPWKGSKLRSKDVFRLNVKLSVEAVNVKMGVGAD